MTGQFKTIAIATLLSLSLAGCKQQTTQSQSSSTPPSPSSPSSSSTPSSPSSSSPSTPSSSSNPSSSSPSTPSSSSPSSNSPGAPSSSGSPSSSSAPSGAQPSGSDSSAAEGSEQPGEQAPGSRPSGTEPGFDGESDSGPGESTLYDSYDPNGDTGTEPSGSNDSSGTGDDAGEAGNGGELTMDDGPLTQGSAQDRQASLEAELAGSMGEYDDMILREREYVLGRGTAKGADEQLEEETPAGRDNDGEGEGGGNINPYGLPGSDNGGAEQGGKPSGNRNGGSPGIPGKGELPPPADIPDGSDDDVVARQIREAALKEKDPKLREKLWQEYRKYKNQ